MMDKILVATDFSPVAAEAQRTALALAKQIGASVMLVHVYSVPGYMFFDGSSFVAPPRVVADIIADGAHRLKQAKEAAADAGVAVETALQEGTAAEEIVRYAQANGFGLIVVGTHGRRGVARLALGSVAEHVVRTAKVPVLTVPLGR
jgi:nucleotide-binding universal stress UspA family protein